MDAHKLNRLLWILAAILLFVSPTRAQTPPELTPSIPVEGAISAGSDARWTFQARDGMVLSFRVEALSQGFDPVLSIANDAGMILITNDDYDYPNSRDSLLEAITIPRTGVYVVIVSGFADTEGDFRLTMQHGFTDEIYHDEFDNAGQWQTLGTVTADQTDSTLRISIEGVQTYGIALTPNIPMLTDYYVQADIAEVTGQNGWVTGLIVRQQDAANYYMVNVSDSGFWRFVASTPDGEVVLRDWAPHPAIVAGESRFTLGVLASGASFSIYYNTQFIGQIDDNRFLQNGFTGVVAGTVSAVGSSTRVRFDRLIVTTPLQVNGGRIFPQRLIVGSASYMTASLQRQGVIPAGGEQALTVNESFGQNVRPGVGRVILARGTTFTNFVLSTSFTWVTSGTDSACGLVFRSIDEENYTLAYVHQGGTFEVSQRTGSTFHPGIFGHTLPATNSTHLLIIAIDNTLHYYVNGQYVGTLANQPVAGEVGNAVVNFQTVDTSCQFTDTWLWRWE